MLRADSSKHIRVRHWADNVVQISELGAGETPDQGVPGALPAADTFDAKRMRLKLRLQLAQRL